jgi:hypothetical protein
MKNLAALTAVLGVAAGLAACSSSGSSAATASASPTSGTETIHGRLTGSAATSDHLVFHLTLTGPVGTTATIRVGALPEKGASYTFGTPVGNLAFTLDSAGTTTRGLKSPRTCLYVFTTTVPVTVDPAKSTGKFAGATGTGRAGVAFGGDDPKFSNGTCNDSATAVPSAKTSVATLTATIKLMVKQ